MRHVRHLLQRHLKSDRYRLLDELRINERLGRDELLRKRQADLNAIVSHANGRTPFYREKYRNVEATGSYEITQIPILRKDEVIAHRDAMVDESIDRSRLKIAHTSGSTGMPLSYFYDDAKHILMRAGMWRSYMWSGWRPGQRILNFWGARGDIKPNSFRRRIDDWISAEQTVDAHEVTEAELSHWSSLIRDYRPVLLQGYASILSALARFIMENRVVLPRTLLGIYSTAEVLYESQRTLLEEAFGCKVFNQYGCREVPNIAVECRHGNQHVFTDMVYLESVREEGEERLLVTSLTNRVMPFIRYELGDIGRLREGDCPCGSSFPLMEMGQCRRNDQIRTRSGKRIHPSYFHHLLDGASGIRQYRFIQTDVDTIVLEVASAKPLDVKTKERLQGRIWGDVEKDMKLLINQVAAIERPTSGKHRFVISELT